MSSIYEEMCVMPPVKKTCNTAEIAQRLHSFISKTGFELVQTNGERRYSPPEKWNWPKPTKVKKERRCKNIVIFQGLPIPRRPGAAPSKSVGDLHKPLNKLRRLGCEVFVGKLPRDCYEDEIVPLFEQIGRVYEVRLMLDFSGLNRGYCFVKYVKAEYAYRASYELDEVNIRPGMKIGVTLSVDNCRLFVGGINLYKTAEEVQCELSKHVSGISKVIMYPSIANKKINRGFVFVEFESHREAAMARRKLVPNSVILWDTQLVVDWAEPEPEPDPIIMGKIRKLYVRGLNITTSEDTIFEIVSSFTVATNILKVKKISDFCFIHFRTRGSAELVLMNMKNLEIDGCKIDVTWARPRRYAKESMMFPSKMKLCMSLPPRLRMSPSPVTITSKQPSPATSISPASPSPFAYKSPPSKPPMNSASLIIPPAVNHHFMFENRLPYFGPPQQRPLPISYTSYGAISAPPSCIYPSFLGRAH